MENYTPEKKTASSGNSPRAPKKGRAFPKTFGIILAAIAAILFILVVFRPVYILKGLGQQEMGVKIRAGKINEIVGPGGVYYDFGLFVRMETYNIEGVPFIASDDEVFTRDMQPVFVEIRGQVFRPSKTSIKQIDSDGTPILFSEEEIKQHYVNYRRIYI